MTYVIIATGESNSGGYGVNANASAGELASRSEVKMWNVNTATFENLDIGTNNNLDHVNLDSTTHGWELQLANDVASEVWAQNPLYYIQTGQGGSVIADWGAAGSHWTKWLARVNAAKSYFSSNAITPEWIVWVSIGINDSLIGTPTATFKTDVIAWINRIKTELPGCKVIMTEVTPTYATFSTAVREIADSETDVTFVSSQGLDLRDTAHWSYAGLKQLSTRLTLASQIGLGIIDGKWFSNYSANCYPDGQLFKWSGASPSESGAVAKVSMAFPDGAFLAWLTGPDAIVVQVESTKDTSQGWTGAETFLYGAYKNGPNVLGGVNYGGLANRGTPQDEARIYRSGNDALLQTRVTGGSWTTIHTATNAFSGITHVYPKFTSVGASSSNTLSLSMQTNPVVTVTAPASADIVLVGTSVDISATNFETSGSFDIVLSLDDGATFPITIASGEALPYAWTPLAAQITATAKIKVSDAADADVFDVSSSFIVATTEAGGGRNTGLWFRLQEMAVNDGLELTRP